MGVVDQLKLTKNLLSNAKARRTGQGFVPRDYGVWRRLEKAGRITTGVGHYGLPPVFTHMYDNTKLTIGNYSSVSGVIMLGGGHPADRLTTYPLRIMFGMEGAGTDGFPAPSKDTVMGSDVYTGYSSMIMSGITIGDGAIVAAGALVTKDVEPYAIVGGNPAKLIRYRFTPEQIAALLEIKWWDWPEEEIRAAVPLINGKDADALIAYARERFPSGAAKVG